MTILMVRVVTTICPATLAMTLFTADPEATSLAVETAPISFLAEPEMTSCAAVREMMSYMVEITMICLMAVPPVLRATVVHCCISVDMSNS